MNKTKIEWCDYTINPIKGLCRNDCWYCYAKRMYKRFKWDEHIRPDFSVFDLNLKKPSRIFVGSTHDIFGDWIPYHWIQEIINHIKREWNKHTFIFLTKNPKRYAEFLFPDNCWLGTSIESDDKMGRLYDLWKSAKTRNIIFASFEPLLSDLASLDLKEYYEMFTMLDWIIIGGLTPEPVHKEEWVNRIIHESCTDNDIPIFLKDNLKYPEKIQEFPELLI